MQFTNEITKALEQATAALAGQGEGDKGDANLASSATIGDPTDEAASREKQQGAEEGDTHPFSIAVPARLEGRHDGRLLTTIASEARELKCVLNCLPCANLPLELCHPTIHNHAHTSRHNQNQHPFSPQHPTTRQELAANASSATQTFTALLSSLPSPDDVPAPVSPPPSAAEEISALVAQAVEARREEWTAAAKAAAATAKASLDLCCACLKIVRSCACGTRQTDGSAPPLLSSSHHHHQPPKQPPPSNFSLSPLSNDTFRSIMRSAIGGEDRLREMVWEWPELMEQMEEKAYDNALLRAVGE